MNSRLSQLLIVIPSLFFLACQAQNITLHQDYGNDDALVCHVFRSEMTYQVVDGHQATFPHDESYIYDCFRGDMSYDLILPQAFIDSHPDLDDGLTHISIPGGRIVNGRAVTYPSNSTITILPKQEPRRRLDAEGTRTVLVVRVTIRGKSFNPGYWSLRERIFDDRPGSLVNQMRSCSRGKVNLVPAEGPGINNGIYKTRVEFYPNGMLHRDFERNHVVPLLDPIGGESAFDHVIYVFPPGTKDRSGSTNWLAYALLNSRRSVYNGAWAESFSALMHETGHLFGLRHANQYGWAYHDATGNMGLSSKLSFGPRACYNGQKHWQLGWYDDKSLDLSNSIRSSPWGGRLVAFVDADRDLVDGDVVVVRIGTLYAQFNRRKDFNDGTREFADRVTIVSDINTRNGISESNLEAGINFRNGAYGEQATFAFPDFEGTGHDLIFEACDQVHHDDSPDSPDYVHLSIHLDDGIQSSMCNVPLPTESPPTPPTSSPTDQVTPSPTPMPSAAPIMDCTGMDLPGLVPLVGGRAKQSCEWIGQRKHWKTLLCRKGYEAFEHCQEMCDSCNNQEPEPPATSDTCEDSPKMFYVNDRLGSRRCFQVGLFLGRSHNRRFKNSICAPDQPAYNHCPELCGKCTDTCEDQLDKPFYVNRRQGHQDCAWLSTRPLWQAILCKEGHDANKYCNELCNTCP